VAEREGFEPSIRCRIHTFQACAIDHSAISPIFDHADNAKPRRIIDIAFRRNGLLAGGRCCQRFELVPTLVYLLQLGVDLLQFIQCLGDYCLVLFVKLRVIDQLS
jgi:hypothetical protein